MLKQTLTAIGIIVAATAVALPAAVAAPGDISVQVAAACNPCAAKKGCNPCAAKTGCNPCAAKKLCANPCNPCGAKIACANPCAAKNPCKAK